MKLRVILKRGLITTSLIVVFANNIQAQSLFVMDKDNHSTTYDIGEINQLIFNNGQLIINKSATKNALTINDIRCIGFNSIISNQQTTEVSSSINCYPNPAANSLHIDTSIDTPVSSIEILNISGQIVLKRDVSPDSNNHLLDISQLNEGIYLCKINTNTTSILEQFIKQ